MDAKLTEKPELSNDRMKVYKINLANVRGSRVYGWLAVPTLPGPHPSILTIPGAGVYAIGASWATGWASRGFTRDTRPCTTTRGSPFSADDLLTTEASSSTTSSGANATRKPYYYLRVCLGCVRAIDYLTSRPDWDGEEHDRDRGLARRRHVDHHRWASTSACTRPVAANAPALFDHTASSSGGRPVAAAHRKGRPSSAYRSRSRKQPRPQKYYDAVNIRRRWNAPPSSALPHRQPVQRRGCTRPYNRCRGPKTYMVTRIGPCDRPRATRLTPTSGMKQQVFQRDLPFEIRGRSARHSAKELREGGSSSA